jgi:hypothetical protein
VSLFDLDRNSALTILGYGYHGDFIMGWNESFLQDAIKTCTNPSGRIEDCPLFNIVDQETTAECTFPVPQPWASENDFGPVPSLPGNVAITYGNETGPWEPSPVSATVGAPTLTYTPGETASAPASPLPGQVFKQSSAVYVEMPQGTSTSAALAEAVLTTAPTQTPSPAYTSASYFSTQYVTNGDLVSEILWEEDIVYVTQYVDATSTTSAPPEATDQPQQRRRRLAHLHEHQRFH